MVTDERLAHYIEYADLVGDNGTPAISTGELAAMARELQSLRASIPGGVGVKGLEWLGEEGSPGKDIRAYPTPEIQYTVRHLDMDTFDVILNTDLGSKWFRNDGQIHASYAQAKAAAQADYERRILSTLLPKATAPVVSEPVAWRCFYCDEVFHSTKEAERHFGPRRSLTERKPACQIDIDHVRKVEQAHEDAMKRVSASAWVNGTDKDREKLEIAATRLFWGQKIEGKPCSQEEWRHIIDRFELWVDVGADGYNVAADRLASLIAFHMTTTQTQSLQVTEEMVERAAKAMWSELQGYGQYPWGHPVESGSVLEADFQRARTKARAALTAALKGDHHG